MTEIKLKKSSISGRVPEVDSLEFGELAINYADGIIYYKNSSNQVKRFVDSDLLISSINNIVDSEYISPLARSSLSAGTGVSYNNTTGVISFSETYSTPTELLTAMKTVDGAGTGLDADELDGQHGSHYRINVYNSSGTLLN